MISFTLKWQSMNSNDVYRTSTKNAITDINDFFGKIQFSSEIVLRNSFWYISKVSFSFSSQLLSSFREITKVKDITKWIEENTFPFFLHWIICRQSIDAIDWAIDWASGFHIEDPILILKRYLIQITDKTKDSTSYFLKSLQKSWTTSQS